MAAQPSKKKARPLPAMNFKKAEKAMAPVPKQLEEQGVQTLKTKSA
jgi:hypothetical protein